MYLEMAAFACVTIGTVMLLGASAYRLAQWWSNRHARRNQQALRQEATTTDDQLYDEMKAGAVRYVEELYSEIGKVD